MAEMRSSAQRNDLRQWAQDMMAEAQKLLQHSEAILHSLFSSGDLTGYLDLLSRLYYYDVVNLLLIYDKRPEATQLGGFKYWAALLPEGSQVLNKDGMGKGIDILTPFTHSDNNSKDHKLVWLSVKVYDILQTNVPARPRTSIYIPDSDHIYAILMSVKSVLKTKFGYTVMTVPPSAYMAPGLPGRLLSDKNILAIQIRSDLSELDQLQYLIEVLIQLSIRASLASELPQKLLIPCISYCLSNILALPELIELPTILPSELSPNLQLPFLTMIHKTVCDLESELSAFYMYNKENREADEEIDIDLYEGGFT